MSRAAADLERALHKVARLRNSFRVDYSHNHVDRVLLEALELAELRDGNELTIDKQSVEALPFRPTRDIGMKTFPCLDERREHLERTPARCGLNLPNDRSRALRFHWQIAIRTKLRADFGEEQPQKMINFGYCRNRRFAAT